MGKLYRIYLNMAGDIEINYMPAEHWCSEELSRFQKCLNFTTQRRRTTRHTALSSRCGNRPNALVLYATRTTTCPRAAMDACAERQAPG